MEGQDLFDVRPRFHVSIELLYPDVVTEMQKFIQTSKQQADLPSLFCNHVPTLFLVGAPGADKSSLLCHIPKIIPNDCVVENITSKTLEQLIEAHLGNQADSPKTGKVWIFDEPLEEPAVQSQLLKLKVVPTSWCCLIVAVRSMVEISTRFDACKVITIEPLLKQNREVFFQKLMGDVCQSNPCLKYELTPSLMTGHNLTWSEAVSELTPSFNMQDLVRLWEVTVQKALQRTIAQGPKPNSKDEHFVEIVWDDVLRARSLIAPHWATAEFDFCVPTGGWNQVGGMHLLRKRLGVISRQWEAHSRHARVSGVLLHGPSGCGKTLVARAFAGEMKCNLISVSLSDLCSKWLGESEAQIRRLFAQAANLHPCILLLEDLDTIGGDREDITGVDRRVVSTLLNELDGVEARPNLLVMGSLCSFLFSPPFLSSFSLLLFSPPFLFSSSLLFQSIS